MYKTFYGLKQDPFDITPDPTFFFATARHKEALANLFYGITNKKGLVVLTGEVCTGKTLLGRCLCALLTRSKIPYAYVFNPKLPVLDFLSYVMKDLGASTTGKSKGDLLWDMNQMLLRMNQQGISIALIVDEAHLLEREVLEEIRLLTNLETTHHKLLQLVLIGQPEFEKKLDSYELRQLRQRVTLRCRLTGLDGQQVRQYIARRLSAAGLAPGGQIFSDASLEIIAMYSKGIPRVINVICENALVAGYARQQRLLGIALLEEVIADLRLDLALDLSNDDVPATEMASRTAVRL
jgi:general secretion pathway protein A